MILFQNYVVVEGVYVEHNSHFLFGLHQECYEVILFIIYLFIYILERLLRLNTCFKICLINPISSRALLKDFGLDSVEMIPLFLIQM